MEGAGKSAAACIFNVNRRQGLIEPVAEKFEIKDMIARLRIVSLLAALAVSSTLYAQDPVEVAPETAVVSNSLVAAEIPVSAERLIADLAAQEESIRSSEAELRLETELERLEAKSLEIQKNKSISYKQESLNYKKKESNLVQDIEISNSLIDSQSLEIASTKDFKSYYDFQKAIKNLDLESQKLNYKNQSYLKLSQQMNAKADALEQKSKLESDPVTKNELLKLSNSFKNQAKINKELSNALVITMDSVKREIKSKPKAKLKAKRAQNHD